MGETAEERARRLARQITINSCYGNLGGAEWWGGSELVINQSPCVEIYDHTTIYYFRQPKVSLVKKYSKNSFKFV
jgi:hypothetical protein